MLLNLITELAHETEAAEASDRAPTLPSVKAYNVDPETGRATSVWNIWRSYDVFSLGRFVQDELPHDAEITVNGETGAGRDWIARAIACAF